MSLRYRYRKSRKWSFCVKSTLGDVDIFCTTCHLVSQGIESFLPTNEVFKKSIFLEYLRVLVSNFFQRFTFPASTQSPLNLILYVSQLQLNFHSILPSWIAIHCFPYQTTQILNIAICEKPLIRFYRMQLPQTPILQTVNSNQACEEAI